MEDVLVYFGSSQTGKSSTLKLLTGDDSVVCGDYGKRSSTTYDIRIYRQAKPKMGKRYLHIDTIGFEDNRLRYSNADIRNKIQMEILRASQSHNINRIKAILLTESLLGDTYQLQKNVKQIINIFGFLPAKSIVVLGTKSDDVVDKEKLQDLQNGLRQNMTQHGLPAENYIRFLTPFKRLNENQINRDQYLKLQNIINRCSPIELQSINEKQEMIKAIALRIQREQLKTVEIEVNQDRIQYKMEKQAYQIDVPREQWRGRIGKILGGGLGGKKTVWHKETHYRDVKVPYTVTETVKKNILVQQQYEYCYRKALEEFEKTILNNLINR